MKMKTTMAMLSLGALLIGAPISAQQDSTRAGARGPRMARPGVERNIDAALARAEALGLDEARVEQLRAMREELRTANRQFGEEARAFAESARAQDRELRESRRSQMRELAERRQTAVAPFQERFESLLSEEERSELRDSVRRQVARRGAVARNRAGGRAAGRALTRARISGRAGAARGIRPGQRIRTPAGRSDTLRGGRAPAMQRPMQRRPGGRRIGVA
jgi:hypothetical protein